VIFRQPSILHNLICPLATRLKSKTRAASSLGSEPCVFTRRRYHFQPDNLSRWVEAGHGFNMPFLTNLTKHAVYKSDKQYRYIPEVAKVSVPPSWPGPTTAASQQVWDLYIIPDMFAQHATGKMTADQAIAWAEKEMQEIYAGRKRRP